MSINFGSANIKSINTKPFMFLIVLLTISFSTTYAQSTQQLDTGDISADITKEMLLEAAKNNPEDFENQADFVEAQLEKLVGKGVIKSISETDKDNVYLYEDVRGQMTYIYVKDSFALVGEAYDVDTKTDLLKAARDEKMVEAVEELPENNFIVLSPQDAERYIDVYTDIDCGYCRKLHFEVLPELRKKGVKARYLMWPRTGPKGESYEKAVTAYCSDNPEEALNQLKAGKKVDKVECDNPIADIFQLGAATGVRGTPTIITDNGKIINGYVPAERILKIMEIEG